MGISNKIAAYIKEWENRCYKSGIPDEVPLEINELCPSYKRIAIAILRNDYQLKSLGFGTIKSRYYDALKKIELSNRGIPIQLKLNL